MRYLDIKKGSLEEAGYKAINEKPDSSSQPRELKEDVNAKELLEAGGKYLKYSDLLLQKGRMLAKNKNTSMIDREIDKEKKKLGIREEINSKFQEMAIVMEKEGDKEKYEKFFRSALKKFGVDSPADFKSDEEKKKFFDYVDKNYTGDHEEEVDLEEADIKMTDQVFDSSKQFKDFFKFMKSKFKLSLKGKVTPGENGDDFTLSGSDTNIIKYLRYLDDGGTLYLQMYKKKGNVYVGEETELQEAIDKKSAQITLKHLKDKGSMIAQTQNSNLAYYLSRMDIQDIKKKGGRPPRGVGPDKDGTLEDLFDAMGVDIYTDGPMVVGKGNRTVGLWKDKTVADIIKMVKVRVEDNELEEWNSRTGTRRRVKEGDGRRRYIKLRNSKDLEKKLNDNADETLDRIREANVQKGRTMRNILADIWNMNEGKNPFEKVKKEEEDEKSSSKKTLTGKKATKVEIEPEIK